MKTDHNNNKIRHILDILGVDPNNVSGYAHIRMRDVIDGPDEYLADKRHFWLFAKQHYKYDSYDEMKQVLGRLCENYTGHYSERDGMSILLHLAEQTILKFHTREHLLREFIERLNPNAMIPYGDSYEERLMNACIGTLGFIEVDHIEGDLGEADRTISPLNELTQKRQDEEAANAS